MNGPTPSAPSALEILLARTYLVGVAFALVNGLPEYLFSIGFFDFVPGDTQAAYGALLRRVLWVKALKDVLLGAVVLLALAVLTRRLLRRGLAARVPLVVSGYAVVVVLAVLVSLGLTLLGGGPTLLLSAAGLRALSPAVLAFVWLLVGPEAGLRASLTRVIVGVAWVATILGLYQAVGYQQSLFAGREGWWLDVRVFSTMSIPSTYAVFLAVALYFVVFESGLGRVGRGALVALILLNILLTGSGMGIVAGSVVGMAVMVTMLRRWEARLGVAVLGVGLVGIVFTQLPAITGRDRIFVSFFERISVFGGELTSLPIRAVLFGNGMGVGTNVARVLARTYVPNLSALIPDSTVTALLVQFGLLGLVLFYVPSLWLTYRLRRAGDSLAWFMLLIMLVSLVTNVFELFPVNWIFFGVCGLAGHRLNARRAERRRAERAPDGELGAPAAT